MTFNFDTAAVLAWLKAHRMTIGAILTAAGAYAAGTIDGAGLVVALIGALSPGLRLR